MQVDVIVQVQLAMWRIALGCPATGGWSVLKLLLPDAETVREAAADVGLDDVPLARDYCCEADDCRYGRDVDAVVVATIAGDRSPAQHRSNHRSAYAWTATSPC